MSDGRARGYNDSVTTQGLPDSRWRLVGARPCLDFVNTVGGRDEGDRIRRDDIPDYDSLLRWSAFASILGVSEVSRLRERARQARPGAGRVLRRAVRFREALYRIGKARRRTRPAPGRACRARSRRRLTSETPRIDANALQRSRLS